jgi:hypothetical protein
MSFTIEIYAFDKKKADKEMSKFIDTAKSKDKLDERYKEHFEDIKRSFEDSDERDILFATTNAYLDFGSIKKYVHSSLGENQQTPMLDTMIEYFKLEEIDSSIPSKESFIKLYSNITKNDIIKMAKKFSKDNDCDEKDGEYYISYTLQSLHTLAKEFKNNPRSILLIVRDDEFPDIRPEGQNDVIRNRVNEIIAQMRSDKKFVGSIKKQNK